jgi:hypothetical protein
MKNFALELFGEAVRKMMCKPNLKHLEVEVQIIQLDRDSQVHADIIVDGGMLKRSSFFDRSKKGMGKT